MRTAILLLATLALLLATLVSGHTCPKGQVWCRFGFCCPENDSLCCTWKNAESRIQENRELAKLNLGEANCNGPTKFWCPKYKTCLPEWAYCPSATDDARNGEVCYKCPNGSCVPAWATCDN